MKCRSARWFAVGLLGLLQACVYVPRTTQVFDLPCRVAAKHMVLQEVQLAAIQHCANEGCIVLVLAAGVATAASVVIFGTLVVAGNMAYWFEKQVQCQSLQ